MNTTLKNISVYDNWENDTGRLCESGERANKLIEAKYFACDYLDFFSDKSGSVLEFKGIVSYRYQFWSNHPSRSERLTKWFSEIDYFITTSLQANNKLWLLREFVWAKFSTIPLLISISTELNKSHTEEIKKLNELMNDVELFLKKKNNSTIEISVIERTRLPHDIVKKINKQRFLNVYQINLAKSKKNIFCEVIETWNFDKKDIDISLPLSIGCVASCKMCEFSLFKPINIPSSTLMQIIDNQVRNNQKVPFCDNPKYNFYYLGGGDAIQYKALPSLLNYVARNFNNPKQVISTIGIGTRVSFNSFLEKISKIPNIGLQWSLNTLNETNRQFITGCNSILAIKTCIELLEEYSKQSTRKVTVSLMLFKDQNEGISIIKKNILSFLNPNFFKINFANIQSNSLEFSKQNTYYMQMQKLYAWVLENKYEATIDSPLEQENQLALCGRTSSTVFNGNQPYLKEAGHE